MRLLLITVYGEMRFWCPACNCSHGFWTKRTVPGPTWSFNGNFEKPSFSPSLRVLNDGETLCHLYVTDGQIQFCADSPHDLKGQTVPMVDWDTIIGEKMEDQTNQGALPSGADLDAAVNEHAAPLVQIDPPAAADPAAPTTSEKVDALVALAEKKLSDGVAYFAAALNQQEDDVRNLVTAFRAWLDSAKAAMVDELKAALAPAPAPADPALIDPTAGHGPELPLMMGRVDNLDKPVAPGDRNAQAVQSLLDKGYSEGAAKTFVTQHGADAILASAPPAKPAAADPPAVDPADAEAKDAEAMALLQKKGYSETASRVFITHHGADRILAEG